MTIRDITNYLESIAPLALQESYDNAGLIVGAADTPIKGVLITLDCTEVIVEEAINNGCNLIIAHHPIVFSGLKKFNGNNYVERTVIKAIQNDIAIYAAHTNLDHVTGGVNTKIAEKIGLINTSILQPKSNLETLVVFAPISDSNKIRKALGQAGAGQIGNYKDCSFSTGGTGRFTPSGDAQPHIGNQGRAEEVEEERIEVIFESHKRHQVIQAMINSHPYEEVAHFISPVNNLNQEVGAGLVGELIEELGVRDFLMSLKEKMNLKIIKHTPDVGRKIKKVALCGGAGSFLLKSAIRQKADIFITGDFKYHEFFDAENKIVIADIGHYESEVFTKDLFYEILSKKFTNIALRLSSVNTNPVNYL